MGGSGKGLLLLFRIAQNPRTDPCTTFQCNDYKANEHNYTYISLDTNILACGGVMAYAL